jgi:transcriptional regulator with XRE-family HTH domain
MAFSSEKLREVRLRLGRTQREVQAVSQASLSAIESGRQQPHPSTLRRLAKEYGVEVQDFFEEVETAPKVAAPPSLYDWLEERCGHAYLALLKGELEEMFDNLPEDAPERRELAHKINHEYHVFCDFPSNVTPEERIAMRKMIREAIPEVAVKHVIALMEGGLDRDYQEQLVRIFDLERATESYTA